MIFSIAQIRQSTLLKQLASLKITVICLALLFILTFWGTIAQVQSGLYLAQERYFFSLFFKVGGFFPFPGARLVLWILFINLLCAGIVHHKYRRSNIGIIITHAGLLLFFIGAGVIFHTTEESNLTLMEGAASNVSSAYHDWEVSVWPQEEGPRHVTAFDTKYLKAGQILDFSKYGFQLSTRFYYPNSEAYTSQQAFKDHVILNRSGISILKEAGLSKEPEQNLPGVIFQLQAPGTNDANVLLYGGESQPTQIEMAGKTYNLILRRKRSELPFLLTLKDFIMEVHPNTEVARSYESRVEIKSGGLTRELTISMNNPLRFKNFTLYQASYSIDNLGREASTLAVVRNYGAWLPYVASLTVVTGLLIHFLMMAFSTKRVSK